jgi:hypothetical protein
VRSRCSAGTSATIAQSIPRRYSRCAPRPTLGGRDAGPTGPRVEGPRGPASPKQDCPWDGLAMVLCRMCPAHAARRDAKLICKGVGECEKPHRGRRRQQPAAFHFPVSWFARVKPARANTQARPGRRLSSRSPRLLRPQMLPTHSAGNARAIYASKASSCVMANTIQRKHWPPTRTDLRLGRIVTTRR